MFHLLDNLIRLIDYCVSVIMLIIKTEDKNYTTIINSLHEKTKIITIILLPKQRLWYVEL